MPRLQTIPFLSTCGVCNSKKVSRVVITSSTGAVITPGATAGTTYTNKDWNDLVVKIVEEEGSNAPGKYKYWASKVLSERGKDICNTM